MLIFGVWVSGAFANFAHLLCPAWSKAWEEMDNDDEEEEDDYDMEGE